MTAATLTVAALLALATDARCGNAAGDHELTSRLVGIAQAESGGDPLAIGVNADRGRNLPALSLHVQTAEEAVNQARSFIAQGRSVDIGLMGINSRNLGNLTVESAFAACLNMREGASHFRRDVNSAVYEIAHGHYNAGYSQGFMQRGAQYVTKIERLLPAIREESLSEAPACAPSATSFVRVLAHEQAAQPRGFHVLSLGRSPCRG